MPARCRRRRPVPGPARGPCPTRLDQPAPLPAWHDPADPRHAINVEHLLRQTSGLDLRQDNTGFDSSAQIMYGARDKAATASAAGLAAAPGTRWDYSDTNHLLLLRVLRDTLGGSAVDVQRFMQAELLTPLGLRHLRLDFDSTGTGIGASHVTASARDWARFGQRYRDDGLADDRRILQPGWVAWSSTPTLDPGYGGRLLDQLCRRPGARLGRTLGLAERAARHLLRPRLHGPVRGGGALAPGGHRAPGIGARAGRRHR